ncbi:LTA synthase family protein [Lederbergia lenta]|uniref:Sulfatase n=1 Tax=Lederbergia lenta TaxID=1467 RepID=A0A2X4WLE2_LEDLE|nr:LTA synthase family protein [Lederbergia lenta]MCM3112766.1 LTA synthase family protein [Lederbergia lenta]MEC2326267.1 LTA synthase family protein [Lederbergia lenta]SQI63769.1 sulfatase [Lederbergia lenta]
MRSRFLSFLEERQNQDISIYISTIFFLSLKMGALYIWVFHINIQSWMEGVVLGLTSIGSAVFLLGIGFIFPKKIRIAALFTIHFLLTLLLFGNVLYYRFYIDFITVPVLLQFQNVGGLSQSTFELISYFDILLFLDFFILGLLLRKNWLPDLSMKRKVWPKVAILAIVVPLALSLVINTGFWKKSYDKELIVKSLGLYHYHLYDLFVYSKTSVNSVFADETEIMEINKYTKGKQKQANQSELHGMAKNKNVVLVFLESTQSFVIDKQIDNQEVTPFLNKLKNESLYFSNFYHQTAQGKTSDAEFIIDNSLYPLPGGSVFVRRPQNEYYSLPHILKEQGYYSASFHGNDAQFWNRSVMYETLGYDQFFSKEYFEVNEDNSVNYGIKDIPFLEQSIPYLQTLPQPFYSKMLTLTNHFPYLLDPEDQFIEEANTSQGVVNRYFTTVRYEDEAIKTFFEQIKDTDLYKDSMFVLIGDHYGISRNYYDALEEVLEMPITQTGHVELQKVPLIIHIPGMEGQVINKVGGQVDLRTTILDLLGIEEEKETVAFGTSLLSENHKNLVIFRDGSFATAHHIFSEGECLSKSTGEKVKRNKCTPYFDQVQRELNYSDKVVFGDLLKFLTNDRK